MRTTPVRLVACAVLVAACRPPATQSPEGPRPSEQAAPAIPRNARTPTPAESGAAEAVETAARGGANPCIELRTEAPWSEFGGYEHVAFLTNGCDDIVSCDVKTERDNRMHRARLGPDATRKVLLANGARDTEFRPVLDCWFE